MKLADDYAEACFDQALHQRTTDDKPETAREKLEKELRRLHARVQELEAAQAQRVPLSVEAIAEIAERFEATDPTDSFWVEVCRAFEGASVSGITQEKQG